MTTILFTQPRGEFSVLGSGTDSFPRGSMRSYTGLANEDFNKNFKGLRLQGFGSGLLGVKLEGRAAWYHGLARKPPTPQPTRQPKPQARKAKNEQAGSHERDHSSQNLCRLCICCLASFQALRTNQS